MNTESISVAFRVIRPNFGVWFPLPTGERDNPPPIVFLCRVTERKRFFAVLTFKGRALVVGNGSRIFLQIRETGSLKSIKISQIRFLILLRVPVWCVFVFF